MRAALLIGLITVAVYAAVAWAPFVYEDVNWVDTMGPDQSFGLLAAHQPPWPSRWLTQQSYRWQAVEGEAVPRSFHLGNLALHLLCGVLVWQVARQMGVTPWLATAIFLWHPLNTEAVAYVSARSDLLMTLGALGAVWGVAMGSWWAAPLIAGGCLLSGLSKEYGAISLAIVALVAGWRWAWVPAVAVVPYALWHVSWPALGAWWTLASGNVMGVWRLVGLLVVPVGLSIDPDPWSAPVALRIVALVALLAAGIWVWRTRTPFERLCAGWIALVLVPRVLVPTWEPIHDQQAYLATVPLSLVVGHWVTWLHSR